MKVTSYRPYASRPAASVEKSGFSALLFPEEHAAAELRTAGNGNTDQLQITNAFPKTELQKTAAAQAQALSRPADADRLAELRSAVQDGSYHIPARDLADAILEWRIL